MKRILIIALFSFWLQAGFGQGVYPYREIKLDKPADFKNAEPLVMSAANYVLSVPYVKTDNNRSAAASFLGNWVTGANEYHLRLPDIMMEVVDNRPLLDVFVAAMAKYCLENKTLSSNPKILEHGQVQYVLAYVNKPENNMPLKKKIRKRLEEN